MTTFRAAVVQMVSTDQIQDNLATATRLIDEACRDGAEFVLLPENFPFMGQEEQDKLAVKEPPGIGRIQNFLSQQAQLHGIWLCGGTIPLEANAADKIRPASLIYNPQGKLVARYDKIHLFDVDVSESEESYRESTTFEPGSDVVVADLPIANIGMSVCYDLRFPELYRAMHKHKVNVITAPSAFTYATGEKHWENLLKTRSVENLCYVIAANQGGKHVNQRRTWGHSMIVNPWGEILACVETGPGFACADINIDELNTLRKQFPALDHRKL